jgi:hypothetical protein
MKGLEKKRRWYRTSRSIHKEISPAHEKLFKLAVDL